MCKSVCVRDVHVFVCVCVCLCVFFLWLQLNLSALKCLVCYEWIQSWLLSLQIQQTALKCTQPYTLTNVSQLAKCILWRESPPLCLYMPLYLVICFILSCVQKWSHSDLCSDWILAWTFGTPQWKIEQNHVTASNANRNGPRQSHTLNDRLHNIWKYTAFMF